MKMKKLKFDGKILIIGYGSVSKCTLPILLQHLDVDRKKITIVDFENKAKELAPFVKTGISYRREKITLKNLGKVLSKYAGENGLVIDLGWNIGADDILSWCHKHNVLYVNTSVEAWDPYAEKDLLKKTLYWRQMKLREMAKNWPKDSVTAVVDHGANPGLISHFTKKALVDIAEKMIKDKKVSEKDTEELKKYLNENNFSQLAKKINVKVIHCSERDTQITNQPKEVEEFVNTWSIAGFHEEGLAPSEMGWGTHEKTLPPLAKRHKKGPRNQIALAKMGINSWARSYVPEVGEIEGMIIRHGEAFGISDRLTVWENGKAVYRPTVHYVYMPCHEALSSLVELRARGGNLQPKLRIMGDEITTGKDILGAFLMGHPYKAWWTGTILSIDQTRKIAPGQNATTLQVAAGIIAAVRWMIENPKKGICLPDDMPHEYILRIAKPYLGELHSKPYDWTPLKNRKIFFKENPLNKFGKDPWQFECFQPLS